MWINKRYKCKGAMRTSSSLESPWEDQFIEGKWYDCSYETSGWYEYKAISESGKEINLSKAEFNVVFFTDIDDVREELISEIIS